MLLLFEKPPAFVSFACVYLKMIKFLSFLFIFYTSCFKFACFLFSLDQTWALCNFFLFVVCLILSSYHFKHYLNFKGFLNFLQQQTSSYLFMNKHNISKVFFLYRILKINTQFFCILFFLVFYLQLSWN